jgi:hypothetical protein
VAALLLLVGLAAGWAGAIPWALGMLGGEYLVSLYVRGGSAATVAAIYGSGLLLLAELAYWSLERQTPSQDEAGLTLRRALAAALLVLGSLGLGLLVAAVTQVSLTGSLLLTAVGVMAAAAALALVAALAWRLRP